MPSSKKYQNHSDRALRGTTFHSYDCAKNIINVFNLEYNNSEPEKCYDGDFTRFIQNWLNDYTVRYSQALYQSEYTPTVTQTGELLRDIAKETESLLTLINKTSDNHQENIFSNSGLDVTSFENMKLALEELQYGAMISAENTPLGKKGNTEKTMPLNYLVLKLSNLYLTYTKHLTDKERKKKTKFIKECLRPMKSYRITASNIKDSMAWAANENQGD
jgi:hypothetical protein